MPDRADYPRLPKTDSVTLPARTRNRQIALGTPTTKAITTSGWL
jgi:hypothetical protein